MEKVPVIAKSAPHWRPPESNRRTAVSALISSSSAIFVAGLNLECSRTAGPCLAKTVGSCVWMWLTTCFCVPDAKRGALFRSVGHVCGVFDEMGASWPLPTETEVDTSDDIDIRMDLEELGSLNLELDLVHSKKKKKGLTVWRFHVRSSFPEWLFQAFLQMRHTNLFRPAIWSAGTLPVQFVIPIDRCHASAKIFIMKWVTVTHRLSALPGIWRRDLTLSLRRVGWVHFESNIIISK